jgi:hypothetical protein
MVVLALVIALTPIPALASPPGNGASPIRQSAAAISTTEQLAVAPATPAHAQAQGLSQLPDTASASFFKKPIGIAVLATLAAGVGYAFYSAKHDHIISAGKK